MENDRTLETELELEDGEQQDAGDRTDGEQEDAGNRTRAGGWRTTGCWRQNWNRRMENDRTLETELEPEDGEQQDAGDRHPDVKHAAHDF